MKALGRMVSWKGLLVVGLGAALVLALALAACAACTESPCKTAADCRPIQVCYAGSGCAGGCVAIPCLDETGCDPDLVCYRDPDEHPFPEQARAHITDERGLCYYPPGDPRIPTYEWED